MARLSKFVLAASLSTAALSIPTVAQGADPPGYVVVDGDSLFAIAARHHVRLADLLRANGLSITSIIYPGQRLAIPGGGTATGAPAGGASYTVRAGDALFAIAARHDVRLADLLRANGLSITSIIHPGQRLTIPGATTSGGGGTRTGTPASGASYTVRAGDAMFAIAARHHVRLADLLRANGLSITSIIHPGQRLTIPGATTTTGGGGGGTPTGGGSYTVRPGDSLSGIAARHKVTLAALLEVNGLTVDSVIQPGQRLTLPAGAVERSSPIERVVGYALAQLGKPYRFFSKGPDTFDCSGLTLAAYSQIGITLIHHSASQARQGTAVDFRREPIRRGDLVFMSTTGGTGINHVGIALDATSWIQARRPGIGVQITAIPPDSLILAVRRFVAG